MIRFVLIAVVIAVLSGLSLRIDWVRDLYCTGRIDAITPGCGVWP